MLIWARTALHEQPTASVSLTATTRCLLRGCYAHLQILGHACYSSSWAIGSGILAKLTGCLQGISQLWDTVIVLLQAVISELHFGRAWSLHVKQPSAMPVT